MAAVVHGVSTSSTAAAASYASDAFVPATDDLLAALVAASDTVATGTMTDSQGLGFTKVTSFVRSGSTDTIYLFIANAKAANSSMTVTFDCTGDNATGAEIVVLRVSGMSKVGLTAILQSAGQNNQGAGGTPAPTFGASALTGNPTIGGIINGNNPAGVTPPGSWTERADIGHGVPTTGLEVVSRDSGFTGTTITWGSTSATAFGSLIAELDSSSSGSTYNETATLTAAGVYATTGLLVALPTLALAGAAVMTPGGVFVTAEPLALAGAAVFATSGGFVIDESVALAGAAAITQSAQLDALGLLALAGAGVFTPAGLLIATPSLALAGAAALLLTPDGSFTEVLGLAGAAALGLAASGSQTVTLSLPSQASFLTNDGRVVFLRFVHRVTSTP